MTSSATDGAEEIFGAGAGAEDGVRGRWVAFSGAAVALRLLDGEGEVADGEGDAEEAEGWGRRRRRR